jgi:hypothetical protein
LRVGIGGGVPNFSVRRNGALAPSSLKL